MNLKVVKNLSFALFFLYFFLVSIKLLEKGIKTLDVHIQRIRERIEENPKKPKRLMTIRGMGYKLIDE